MRYICHLKPTRTPRHSTAWHVLLAGVSLLAISVTTPARAQNDQFAVDVSDPSISIDLSVLNDGGLGAPMGAMPSSGSLPYGGAQVYGGAQARGGAQAPGPNLPVSTLYVQPSAGFTLPPQTKAMIARPAPEPEPEMDVAEDMLEPTAPEEPVVEENLAEGVPSAPLIEPAAPSSETVVSETAPATVAEETSEPAAEPAVEPAKEVAAVEPETAPASAPEPTSAPDTAPISAVTQEPMEEPVAPTETAEAATPAEQTPPPPPQALSQTPATAEAVTDEATETAQQDATPAPASPSSVVVDLPPKLEEMQPGVASLPPSTGPLSDGDNMRIVFENDSSKLPTDAREALKTLSARMNQQDGLRLQLLAYAGGTDTSASAARRLSLSRALAVRSYLIENGVRSTRIDVRALGNKSTEAVTERVDITIVER